MKIIVHKTGNLSIAEVFSDYVLINNVNTGKALIADFNYQFYDGIILHSENIIEQFFDLKSRMAGEILQQATNFRIRVGIVGEFDKYGSKSLNDFIRESNKQGKYVFESTVEKILDRFKS